MHGQQGIGLVCTHVAHAVDRGEKVGFYWGNDTDTARPDAWCAQCEKALIALEALHLSNGSWMLNLRSCVLHGWDEAKAICGGFGH